MIKVGSDFSGVGAFDFALGRITPFQTVFACDWDKYARQSYIANHGEPKYYPKDVYEREIPEESLDIYMTSPPCQSFSLAGKREGKNSDKGILFFNSHEFIQKNKPRFFIFENVKGLLSDDEGNTFQEWVNMLGGKSVNGLPILFPYDNSVPYHLYWQVLNSKKHGVPQNRERVFLVGIRDDEDNKFQFPKEEHLTKRLKDVLEEEVFEKYFLSDQQVQSILNIDFIQEKERIQKGDFSGTLLSRDYKSPKCVQVKSNLDKYYLSKKMIDGFTKHNENHNEKKTGFIFEPKNENDIANCLRANSALCPTDNTIKIESATQCNENVICGALRGRGENNKATLELNSKDHSNAIITSQLANLILAQTLDTRCNQGVIQINPSLESGGAQPYQQNRVYDINGIMPALNSELSGRNNIYNDYKIRRLTPRECFRLQDFPDTFKFVVSDSQLYKQAGNSITVRVLEKILRNLKL